MNYVLHLPHIYINIHQFLRHQSQTVHFGSGDST